MRKTITLEKSATVIGIVVILSGAFIAWGATTTKVEAHERAIGELQGNAKETGENLAETKGELKGIRDRVDDIAAFLRVPKDYGKAD